MRYAILIIFLSQLDYLWTTTAPSDPLDKYSIGAHLKMIDLPEAHLIRYFNNFPQLKNKCEHNANCRQALKNNTALCWGYERNCAPNKRFQTPSCPGEHTGWVQSKQAQIDTFYSQADFGYVRQQTDELMLLCEPTYLTDSSLECTKYLRFCRGRNLFFDFRDLLQRKEQIRYSTDVLKWGQVAGHCQLNNNQLQAELDHNGALQSWSPEMRHFVEMPAPVMSSSRTHCDLVIDRPTFIMKIDSTYNMYHHFCDFFNLYATLFVNTTHPLSFSKDVRIIIWETYPYDSPFAETFQAFTRYPVWTLNEVKGKRVCFRNVVLPLLPRMIFGLYYNTPIISGCQNSGLFRAFSEFVLHRLQIAFEPPFSAQRRVRITILSRRTKYRRVLNEFELLKEIEANETYIVRRVSYESGIPFSKQLAITRNTDVLIGMHGAGLTHLLFLPNWATIFELYNCGDPNCYRDLARLRGVNYVTWTKTHLLYPQDDGHHPEGGAHEKFTNYSFDRKEFARLVAQAAEHVLHHSEFIEFRRKEAHLEEAFRDEL